MNLLERTLKMTFATLLAILLAQVLQLSNAYAAGIIAILSLLDTKLDTLRFATSRILSMIIAFIIAWIIFSFAGFDVWLFTLFLLIYIPICYYLGIQAGIAPSSVLVTHFITAENVGNAIIINGGLLMIVGIGSAMVLNFWMPSKREHLKEYQVKIERQIVELLQKMSLSLNKAKCDVRSIQNELRILEHDLDLAQKLSLIEYNNSLVQKNDYLINYFAMRSVQVKILQGLAEMLPNIPLEVVQGEMLSKLLLQTAHQFGEHNTGIELIEGVAELYRYSRQSELPKTREEFEARAMIYAFLIEFNRFLEVKRDFYLQYLSESNE